MTLIRSFLLLLASALFLAPSDLAQPIDGGHARVELISERALAVPGETVWFGLSFEIDPNWHIYWVNPGDAGIAPEITWRETGGISAEQMGKFVWPLPELLPVVPGQIMDYGYSDTIVLPFPVTLPEAADGPILFEGTADYLICEDICIPESAEVRLLLSVGAAQLPDATASERIQSALEAVPPRFEGEASVTKTGDFWTLSLSGDALAGKMSDVRFFPYDHEISHAADQMAAFGEAGLSIQLTPATAGASAPETLAGVVQVGDAAFDITATSGRVLSGTSGIGGFSGSGAGAGGNLALLMGFALIAGSS